MPTGAAAWTLSQAAVIPSDSTSVRNAWTGSRVRITNPPARRGRWSGPSHARIAGSRWAAALSVRMAMSGSAPRITSATRLVRPRTGVAIVQ
ncbi:MAG: hypothetical protein KF817_05565 [Phycisphaeraceae bacterium]|nr:hypothetical protein [Phycisphaeraceae bacterium]